jgi:ketosteroid isomerase-like protein
MSQEYATPDPVELVRQAVDSLNHHDLDAVMRLINPDAVWDESRAGVGTFEGAAAIRSYLEDWIGAFDKYEVLLEEVQDLGNGVIFAVGRLEARVAGSMDRVSERRSWVGLWVQDGFSRMTVYPNNDPGEARAAAERLAKSRE